MILGIRADADSRRSLRTTMIGSAASISTNPAQSGRDAANVDSIIEIGARLGQRRGARLPGAKLDSGEYSGVDPSAQSGSGHRSRDHGDDGSLFLSKNLIVRIFGGLLRTHMPEHAA